MPIAANLTRGKLTTFASILFVTLLVVAVSTAAGAQSTDLSSTVTDGQRVSGNILWRVFASGRVPSRIDFSIDGTVRWTERNPPYDYNGNDSVLDTTELSEGAHVLRAVAYAGSGTTGSTSATVIVDNVVDTAPPAAGPAGTTDLALGKVASASSVEPPDQYNGFGVFSAAKAVDGDGLTRWSSSYADNQWWQVDLGSAQSVSSVSVVWEAAYASSYKIQVSTNGTAFTDVATVAGTGAGVKLTSFTAVSARYVRVLGVSRATPYGLSFFTVQVFGPSGGGAVPVNSVLPVVSGSVVQGQTLSASTGTWSNAPTSYAYQWRRCDSGGANCVNVGSGLASYVLAAADVGSTVRVVVTASNGSGPGAPATSLQTGVVTGSGGGGGDLALGKVASASSVEPPDQYNGFGVFSAAKAVDGDGLTRWSSSYADNQWWQVDLGSAQSVSSVSVVWEAAYASSYKIQVSTNGTAFTDVASETMSAPELRKSTFPPVNARYVRVLGLTRGTPYGFSVWEIRVYGDSTPTAGGAPLATQTPSISGTTQVGSRLTSSPGTWNGSPSSYAYKWSRCSNSGSACSDIAGATSSSYTPVTADAGATLRVMVSATNTVGTGTSASDPTAEISPTAPTPVSSGSYGSKLPPRLGPSSARALYVSGSNGSDGNAGTIGAPFATIGKAWSVAGPGTTINVRGGSYAGQINLQAKTASAASPITVRAYPGERVALTGPSNEAYPAVFISRSVGVRLQGFEIANDKGDGVKIDSATNVEIVGNDIHDNGMQGIIVGAGAGTASPTYSSNVQIWSNRIHNNGGWWPNNDPYAAFGTHGVYYGNAGSNTDGIQHGTVGGVIADNLFYDQASGYHIQVGSQNNGLVITNNTFDNAYQPNTRAGNAVQIYGEGNAFATKNVLVVNNIIANSANRGVYGSGGTMTSNVVRNNLAFNNPRGDFEPTYGSSTLFTLGAGNAVADPRFTDRSSKAYQLSSGSPAIGRADAAYTPPTDFYGRPRVGAPDLGATEYQG